MEVMGVKRKIEKDVFLENGLTDFDEQKTLIYVLKHI